MFGIWGFAFSDTERSMRVLRKIFRKICLLRGILTAIATTSGLQECVAGQESGAKTFNMLDVFDLNFLDGRGEGRMNARQEHPRRDHKRHELFVSACG
jgi:hypothetical protein